MHKSDNRSWLVLIFLIYLLPSFAVALLLVNFWFCFFSQCLGYQNTFLFLSTIFLGLAICFWFSFSTLNIINYLTSQQNKKAPAPIAISKRKQIALYVVDFLIVAIFYKLLTVIYLLLHPEKTNALEDEIYGGYFIAAIIYFFVSTFFFRQTIGTLATGSYMISASGGKPTLAQALKRTLTLFVPYNFVSFFAADIPYHDYFAKTLVIEQESEKKNKLT